MISPPFCMIFGVSIKNSKLAKFSSALSQANNILTSIERVEENKILVFSSKMENDGLVRRIFGLLTNSGICLCVIINQRQRAQKFHEQ